MMQAAAKVNPSDVTVTITITPDPANPDPGNQLEKSNAGDLVSVSVSVPFNKVQYVTGNFLGSSKLTHVATMRHE